MPLWTKLLSAYLLVMNLAAFGLMWSDKRRARRGEWRIPERTLLLTAALGGSLGGVLGMDLLRHKTRHWYFRFGLPLLLLLHLAALAALGLWQMGLLP